MSEKQAREKISPGDRFGDLTVVRDSGKRKDNSILWTCRCELCGREIELTSRMLKHRAISGCGCQQESGEIAKDITGCHFGRLTADYLTESKRGDGDAVWHCTCSCGTQLDVPFHQLVSGYRKSCGCFSRPQRQDPAAGKIGPGYRFGHLTVEADTGERKKKYIVWRCRCDCGGTTDLDVRTIQRGTILDCGCITKVKPHQRDITGERYGKLTALRPTGETRSTMGAVWHCRCDCGNEIDVPLQFLRQGSQRSCGCLSRPPLKDYAGRRFGRLTVTEYAGKWNGLHHWKALCDCGNETVVDQTSLQSGNTRSCGCLQSEMQRKALKLVDGTSVAMLEKQLNTRRRTNTSGCTGVYLNKKTDRWVARIGFKKKTYYLGTFQKKEDAIRARKDAEDKVYREFITWYYDEYLPGMKERETKSSSAEQQMTATSGQTAERLGA